ncbi:AMP-binding protein [Streptomyces sp. NPDC047024]|uniref:class I adenylate-forming enzyme family protein n=1 Tax=Streptomyces sp. NPDC047024 TaxID=3155476 RepID=UPI0033E5B909
MTLMTLSRLPAVRAAQAPHAPALTDEENGTLSNAAFAARVEACADRLARLGVRPGDIVAVRLSNRAELVVTLFAAWRLGAALTPVNPALTPAETGHQLRDSGARVLVTDQMREGLPESVAVLTLDDLTRPLPASARPLPASARPVAADPGPDDLALVIYTSGTTGSPKGVELTHRNIDAMTATMIEATRLTESDHSLLVLPLFHVNGIVVGVLSPLRAGGRATVLGRFSARNFFAEVERARPTCFSAVPAIYAMLTGLPPEVRPDTSSLRFAACGAAPMPPQLIAAWEQRFGVPVVEGYGLSEATCASTANPLDGPRKPGTVGPPLPGQRVAVMDEHGRLITDGRTGEVVISGPTVMRGYLGRPEETAAAVRDGWLHTGDVGRLDEDGYLVLVDRLKDMIIRGGENIYPKEIETVLHDLPGVLEAAVVGRPDDVLGEVPVAFVAPREGSDLTLAQVTAFCAERLAPYKRPAEVFVVSAIPKNPVGKPDKPALRRRVLLAPA